MAKDILGNEIDEQDLDGFEQGQDDDSSDIPETPEPSKTDEDDFSEVVEQLESGKELELDPEKPVSIHKQKKANRWHEHTQKAERERLARLEAERRAELAERELQVWRQATQQQTIQTPQQDTGNNDEVEQLYEQQARLYDLYNRKAEAGNVTPEETAKFQKEARGLQTKVFATIAKGVFQSQPQQNVGEQALQAQLQMQYPEIYSDSRAKLYAEGLYKTKIASGDPVGVETIKKALHETAKRFKFASAMSETDDATKRRFTGPMRGSNARTAAIPKIPITKDILRIANATYPHIEDEKDRLKEWIKVHGKDYAEGLKSEQG